jgi:hypothetical protein
MALFKDGILKHSTPINSHYFFNNRNIEDRVTLLGVAVNIVLSAVKLFGGIGKILSNLRFYRLKWFDALRCNSFQLCCAGGRRGS